MVSYFRILALLPWIFNIIYAQNTPSFDKNIRLDEQKKIYERLEQQQNSEPIRYEIQKPQLQIPSKQEQPCVHYQEITYENITLISASDVDTVLRRYVGKCISEVSLKNLLNELSTLYLDKGYITSRVYLKEQDASSGHIHLLALEGKIESINAPSSDIALAFESQDDTHLNIRSLETALSIVNRLPSNNVTMQLIPSETQIGKSVIQLDNNRSKPLGLEINGNNYGSQKTGHNQISAKISYDNILDLNDQLVLNLNTTDHHFQNENSKGNTFSYSIPIGTVIYTLSYTDSNYKQQVPSGTARYPMDGNSKTYELSATKELFHNQSHTFNMSTSLSSYEVESYLSNSLIDTSSYRLSKASLSLDYSYRTQQLFSYMMLKYLQGVDWFGTHNPTSLDEKYSAFQFDASLIAPVETLRYKLNFHGQYSNDRLFSVNQINIGGEYSVRGYQNDGLSGNSGFYLRNEMAYPSAFKPMISWLDITPYFALDTGYIHKEDDSNGGSLMSSSVGLQINKYAFFADISYSVPLWKQDVQNARAFFGVSLTYKY
jgi:hemolysin activation/secretion protein